MTNEIKSVGAANGKAPKLTSIEGGKGTKTKAPRTKTTTDTAKFNAAVDLWSKAAHKVEADFHLLAITGLVLVMATKNATPLKRLQNGMPKSMRKREFAAWLGKYSPVRLYNEDSATSNFNDVELRVVGDKHYHPFNIEGATADPFFNKKEEVKALDPTAFDDAKRWASSISQMFATATKATAKAKPLATGVTLQQLQDQAKATINKWRALVAAKLMPPIPDKVMEQAKAIAEVTPPSEPEQQAVAA